MGSWSIEKPVKLSDTELDEDVLFGVMNSNYKLTEEQLEENGFPRPDPLENGKAIIKVLDFIRQNDRNSREVK